MQHVDAHPLVERLEIELRHTACPVARVGECAGLGLCERQELLQRLDVELRVDDEYVRAVGCDADVAEVLERIVRQLHVQARIDRQ